MGHPVSDTPGWVSMDSTNILLGQAVISKDAHAQTPETTELPLWTVTAVFHGHENFFDRTSPKTKLTTFTRVCATRKDCEHFIAYAMRLPGVTLSANSPVPSWVEIEAEINRRLAEDPTANRYFIQKQTEVETFTSFLDLPETDEDKEDAAA
jgi:hypothetical protein